MQTSFSDIPNDLTFHIVTGSSLKQCRNTIKNFLLGSRALRVTNSKILLKVDACWKNCIENLWNQWKKFKEMQRFDQYSFEKAFTYTFFCDWVYGNQKFNVHFESHFDSLTQFKSLEFINTLAQNALLSNIPIKTSPFVYSKNDSCCDEIFSNTNLEKIFQYDHHLKPIWFNDKLFLLLFKNCKFEMQIYNAKLFLIKQVLIPINQITEMTLAGEYIYFDCEGSLRAININTLLSSTECTIYESELIKEFNFIHPFGNHLLLCTGGTHLPFCIQLSEISENKIIFQKAVIEGASISQFACQTCEYSFLEFSKFHVFLFKGINFFWIATVPLIFNIKNPTFKFYPKYFEGSGALIEYKNELLLCTWKPFDSFEMKRVIISNDAQDFIEIPVKGLDNLSFIYHKKFYVYLDKLFIIGLITNYCKTLASDQLLIIDLASLSVEQRYSLGVSKSHWDAAIFSSSLGSFHVIVSEQTESSTKCKYRQYQITYG